MPAQKSQKAPWKQTFIAQVSGIYQPHQYRPPKDPKDDSFDLTIHQELRALGFERATFFAAWLIEKQGSSIKMLTAIYIVVRLVSSLLSVITTVPDSNRHGEYSYRKDILVSMMNPLTVKKSPSYRWQIRSMGPLHAAHDVESAVCSSTNDVM